MAGLSTLFRAAALSTIIPLIAAANPLEDQIAAAFEAGELPGLHTTKAVLGETVLAEVYLQGEDEVWGAPLGDVQHGPDTLHDLRSVTKSIVGLLYGIALSEGKVPAPDQPLLEQFPEYADLSDGGLRDAILVEHALSMKMGSEWDETLPYSDPANSEIAMERADDRYRFVLSRPMVGTPGVDWTYSGGAVAILAKLIADGTGMSIDDYARTKLFEPLGIESFEWVKGADNVPSAASGLRLTTDGLLRIGIMVANGGVFDGQQIVDPDWLAASFEPQIALEPGFSYGYLWYIAGTPDRLVVMGLGNGGQRLSIQPDAKLVVASFAGNYNDPNGWKSAYRVLTEFVVPEAKRRLGRD